MKYETQATATRPEVEAARYREARLLIVDDTADSVQLLEAMLRTEGYHRIRSTTDPYRAVAVFEEFQPDLVLLDLMMPGLDGCGVLARLRRVVGPDTYLPVLVLTGDTSPASRDRALRAGARDFLVKPFDQGEVLLRIDNLLQTRFLNLQLQRQNQALEEQISAVLLHKNQLQEAQANLQSSEDQLQVLSQRLIQAQETERRHIARELHDEIGQSLTAIKINLQAAQRLAGTTLLPAHLEEGIGIVERALQQVRDLSLNLRPTMLDDFGVAQTLAWYIDRYARWAGIIASFRADDMKQRFAPEVETACFRITQEALTNVLRHAGARRVAIRLRRRPDELVLTIRDDGAGFDVRAAGGRAAQGHSIGLPSMEERALLVGGRVEIRSRPGRGTRVCARFPLQGRPKVACRKAAGAGRAARGAERKGGPR